MFPPLPIAASQPGQAVHKLSVCETGSLHAPRALILEIMAKQKLHGQTSRQGGAAASPCWLTSRSALPDCVCADADENCHRRQNRIWQSLFFKETVSPRFPTLDFGRLTANGSAVFSCNSAKEHGAAHAGFASIWPFTRLMFVKK